MSAPFGASQLAGQVALAVTDVSGRVALPSAASLANALTIINYGDTACFIKQGDDAVVAADTDILIPPGIRITIGQAGGYIAAITAASTTNLVIYQGTGPV